MAGDRPIHVKRQVFLEDCSGFWVPSAETAQKEQS